MEKVTAIVDAELDDYNIMPMFYNTSVGACRCPASYYWDGT